MRLGSLPRLTAGVVAALLLASGCGGTDAPEGPLGDASAGRTTGTSRAVAEKPTQPAVRDDAAGRERFARWFADALGYAFATNDASQITAVASTRAGAECVTCQDFADYLGREKQKGRHLADNEFAVQQALETAQPVKGVYVWELRCDNPAYTKVDRAGSTIQQYPAERVKLQVGVTFQQGRPRITGWKTDTGESS